MEQKLIDEIQKLGFNSYEARAYIALLERNSLTAGEVAKLSGVPRARIYGILDKLVADGLARLKPGKVKKYGAVDSDSFQQILTSKNEKRYAEQNSAVEQVTSILQTRFASAVDQGQFIEDPFEYIEVIKNPYQIHRKFLQLSEEAKEEILVFVKPPYSGSREQIEQQLEQRAALLKKGIVIKGVYDLPEDKQAREMRFRTMAQVVHRGELAKMVDELPMKMAIFDERIVLIALEDPVLRETSLTTLFIEHRSLARSLKILFNYIMEGAEDYRDVMDRLEMKEAILTDTQD
ncbi:MAG: hypothetical protein KKH67_12850 [candidate division Zixibacteria bacterium]|nr:hypothetical protein [candidate division Zixibacteria bacterium]MBU1470539.1 hypothetical protein [candidate division Zixibacteria bacterium]